MNICSRQHAASAYHYRRFMTKCCLVLCFSLYLLLPSRVLADDVASMQLPSRAFLLWFEAYGDDDGDVLDPLDVEQLIADADQPLATELPVLSVSDGV